MRLITYKTTTIAIVLILFWVILKFPTWNKENIEPVQIIDWSKVTDDPNEHLDFGLWFSWSTHRNQSGLQSNKMRESFAYLSARLSTNPHAPFERHRLWRRWPLQIRGGPNSTTRLNSDIIFRVMRK